MGVPLRHVLRQGAMIATVMKTGAGSLGRRFRKARPEPVECPGPAITATLPPRHRRLVRDYIAHVGGDPAWYGDSLPPHMFCQWGLPLLARALKGVPYDMSKVLNAGCRLEVRRPLPSGEPLQLEARLENVDDNGRRAIIEQRLVTGTASAPDALICHVNALVRLRRSDDGTKKPKPAVPDDAREVERWLLPKRSGLRFAMLTGDFNPIHWIGWYARMAGFKGPIPHGFSTLARVVETLNRELWAGRPDRLATIEARFVQAIVLPAEVGVYLHGSEDLFVGNAPGSRAYLVGRYTQREEDAHG
ncbi:MAG: hypothetical protein JXQ73_03945 [Phycisphaerae bacterium]|nr:hypothetical protein [Phycisphaerae bacterium]